MDFEIERLGAAEREWAHLPEELLREISSKLFAKDVKSFSLVCKSWSAVVKDSFFRRSPCLMFYHRAKRMWKVYQHTRFIYMSLPELDSAYMYSSNYGWLLMSRNDQTLFFFDPFNGRKIELPGSCDDDYTTIHFFCPPTSPECFVIGIKVHDVNSVKIGILKHGQDNWVSYICGSTDPFDVSLAAPVLLDELVYFVDLKGNIATLDVDDIESSWTVYTECVQPGTVNGQIRQHYLLEMKDEEALYAVFMVGDARILKVFRLSEEKMEWEEVESLEARSLYLSQGCSYGDIATFTCMTDLVFLPVFKLESDDILLYCMQAKHYRNYDFDYLHRPCDHPESLRLRILEAKRNRFINPDLYGLRRLDAGVTWIMPAWPQDDDLLTWYGLRRLDAGVTCIMPAWPQDDDLLTWSHDIHLVIPICLLVALSFVLISLCNLVW